MVSQIGIFQGSLVIQVGWLVLGNVFLFNSYNYAFCGGVHGVSRPFKQAAISPEPRQLEGVPGILELKEQTSSQKVVVVFSFRLMNGTTRSISKK